MLTTCPECHTTFRIGHEQLEARRGLVRCGTCSAVFNAYDTLLPELSTPPLDEVPPGPMVQPEAAAPSEPAPAAGQMSVEPAAAFADEIIEVGEPAPEPARAEAEEGRAEAEPPLAVERYDAPEPVAAIRIQDELVADRVEVSVHKDASGPREQVSADEILLSDLPTRQGKAAAGPVWKTLLQSLLVLLLVLAFLAQLAYFLRGEIASRQPEARPWLEAACQWVGCRIPLARDLDLLRVEWSSLETDPEQPSQARLRVTLSNRSQAEQAWPYLILKLTDAKNAPLAQRAFAPADYLPRDRKPADGVRPMSEQEFRVDLDLAALEAAGYEVRLHYP